MNNLLAAWNKAQAKIKDKVGISSYQSWFSNITAFAISPEDLILETPDEFFKNWIAEHYLEIIHKALEGETSRIVHIELKVAAQNASSILSPTMPALPIIQVKDPVNHKKARFTFESFVMGPSNAMPFKACQAVAENPARDYNPLFIYGPSGMGKTHLLRAIVHHAAQKFPQRKSLYITSEQFTNDLIEAIGKKRMGDFKTRYRNVDILLIDDVHSIAGRESTQEEFFNTFNELHNNRKQIILTSDRPAKEIARLEDRLVTRFTMGLTVDIQPPDYETRVAILRKKLELEEVRGQVPDDVVLFIAQQIKTNIRELEGALIRVVAYSLLGEKKIDLALAQGVLKDMVKETTKSITIEMIQQVITDHFHITVSELKSSKRTQNISLPRQIAMYLCRTMTRHSLPEIGKAFGGKDHATVIYACKKIEEDVNKNSEIKYIIEKLTQILNY